MTTLIETIRSEQQRSFWRESEKFQRFSPENPPTSTIEQFNNKDSLVSDPTVGTGPIRHIDIRGVCYHGLNNSSHPVEKNNSKHFSKAEGLTASDFKHCIFQSERYKENPYHEQWDTHDAHQFCTNCVFDEMLSKRRSKVKVYRCLGH